MRTFAWAVGVMLLGGSAGRCQAPQTRGLGVAWSPVGELGVRRLMPMVADPIRGRVVAFGGSSTLPMAYRDETWEWDGRSWTRMNTAVRPSARDAAAMAWDPVRRAVILFGGRGPGDTDYDDTWEWNGHRWLRLDVAARPSPRAYAAVATDLNRGRIVLFGGAKWDAQLQLPIAVGETWEWEGRTWVRVVTNDPSRRAAAGMAFDATHGRIVMSGGSNYWSILETLAFDGRNWTSLPTLTTSYTSYLRLATDPVRGVVLFGSYVANATWRLDGNVWRELNAGGPPAPQGAPSLTFDPVRREVVMLDASKAGTEDTWAFDGSTWRLRPPTRVASNRIQISVAYDRSLDTFVVGGWIPATASNLYVWGYRPETGHAANPVGVPRATFIPSVIYDPVSGQSVIFSAGLAFGWDGTRWVDLGASSARHLYGSGFDPRRQRTLAMTDAQTARDLMEWSLGTGWTLVNHSPVPPGPAAAFDVRRGRMVTFGGTRQGVTVAELWEWDGVAWSQVPFTDGPPARSGARAVYVPELNGILFAGGASPTNQAIGDCWLWDGVRWTSLPGARGPVENLGPLVYDPTNRRVVAFDIDGRLIYEMPVGPLRCSEPHPAPGGSVRLSAELPGRGGELFVLAFSGSPGPGIPLRSGPMGIERLPLGQDPLLTLSLGAGIVVPVAADGAVRIDLPIPTDRSLAYRRLWLAGFTVRQDASFGEITNSVELMVVR